MLLKFLTSGKRGCSCCALFVLQNIFCRNNLLFVVLMSNMLFLYIVCRLCLKIIRIIIVSAFRTLYSGAFVVSSITPLVPPVVDSR